MLFSELDVTGAVFEGTSKGDEKLTCPLTTPTGWETKIVTLVITDFAGKEVTWTWKEGVLAEPADTGDKIRTVVVKASDIRVAFKPPSDLVETKSYTCEVNVFDPADKTTPEATDSALVHIQKIGKLF